MPGYATWKAKLKILLRFSILQGSIQAVMAISGFLIVRVLDKREFAAYTIAASLQTLLNSLTDCGLGAGLNAIGGRVWKDSHKLGQLVKSGLRLRWHLAWFAVPVTVMSALLLLRRNGVGWFETAALTVGVVTTLGGTFLVAVYATPLRLLSLYTTVQKIDLSVAALRVLLLGSLALFYLNALTALLVTAVILAAQGMMLRRKAAEIVALDSNEDEEQRITLVGLIKKQFLSTLFFAYQGQITIWIITIFGSVEKVADVGALSRLAIIFAIVASILTGLVAPTLARCETFDRLVRLFGLTLLGYSVFAMLLLTGSIAFPEQFLWVLGHKYSGLTLELPWLVANSVVGGFIWVVHTVALARGWVWQAWLIPILTLLTQAGTLRLFDLSSVRGVLVFSLVSSVPTLVVTNYMTARGLAASWRAGSLVPTAS